MLADSFEVCSFAKTDCKVSQSFRLLVCRDTIDGITRGQHIGNRYAILYACNRLIFVLDVDDANVQRLLFDVIGYDRNH